MGVFVALYVHQTVAEVQDGWLNINYVSSSDSERIVADTQCARTAAISYAISTINKKSNKARVKKDDLYWRAAWLMFESSISGESHMQISGAIQ